MGGGFYSTSQRATRAATMGYTNPNLSAAEVFTKRSMPTDMDPQQIRVREARDSGDHPISFPLIIALDQTGSMHHHPRKLIADGLPTMITTCHELGLVDIAVMFLAIGDHSVHYSGFHGNSVEQAPLQIGQFESDDEKMDHWLSSVFLEGMGGGNGGESYMLAHIVAAFICQTDSFERRNRKGVLITIGDEPCLPSIDADALKRIFGDSVVNDFPALSEGITAAAAVEAAKEQWHVHHLHCLDGSYGTGPIEGWQQLIGSENVHPVTLDTLPGKIAEITDQCAAMNPNSASTTTDNPPHIRL